MKNTSPTKILLEPVISEPGQLGAIIRSARKASGLTIVEAAASIGIAKQTLANIERGRNSVGIQTVLKVATDLGVSIIAIQKNESAFIRRTILESREESS